MRYDSKIAGKIKAQITRFANRLTEGLTKPERRFIREVIYGIQASKDVKLSNIARSLGETIPLIKTEWRLSRNAAKSDFTDLLNARLISLGKNRITDNTVLYELTESPGNGASGLLLCERGAGQKTEAQYFTEESV